MNLQERRNRIIARGEHSDHCHAVVNGVTVDNDIITVNSSPDYEDYLEKLNDFLKSVDINQIQEEYPKFLEKIKDMNVAKIRHIKESSFLSGEEVWTKEHLDIPLKEGVYKYVPQVEFDPFEEIVRKIID